MDELDKLELAFNAELEEVMIDDILRRIEEYLDRGGDLQDVWEFFEL